MLKDIITQRIKNQKGSIIYTYTFFKWNGLFKDKNENRNKNSDSALCMKETEIIIKTFS